MTARYTARHRTDETPYRVEAIASLARATESRPASRQKRGISASPIWRNAWLRCCWKSLSQPAGSGRPIWRLTAAAMLASDSPWNAARASSSVIGQPAALIADVRRDVAGPGHPGTPLRKCGPTFARGLCATTTGQRRRPHEWPGAIAPCRSRSSGRPQAVDPEPMNPCGRDEDGRTHQPGTARPRRRHGRGRGEIHRRRLRPRLLHLPRRERR